MVRRHSFEERAKRIVDFYLRVDKDKKKVLKHFKEEGVPPRSVHRIIQQFEERGDASFKKIPGRNRKISADEAYDRVASLFKENPKMSCGGAATELGVSKSTVLRILRQMRSDDVETYREIETVICPTCHQKCDPKVLEAIKKRKKESQQIRAQNMQKKREGTKSSIMEVLDDK